MLQSYQFDQPFHLWLNEQFRKNRSFGSKDRRFYRELLYSWLKLAGWGNEFSIQEQLALGWIRQNPEDIHVLESMPDLFSFFNTGHSFSDFCLDHHLPWSPYASFSDILDSDIHLQQINQWFGKPAPVWIRAAKGKTLQLTEYLKNAGIGFVQYENAFKLNQATSIAGAMDAGLCYVQDLGSQLSIRPADILSAAKVLDACCGAGGKSLLISESLSTGNKLWITDIREQIVKNALQRFSTLGYPMPEYGVNDLKAASSWLDFNESNIEKEYYDLVVCDVPCSGSGTWRRNPEELIMFRRGPKDLSGIQRKIVQNASEFLKPGGRLIYLTCSVFKAENTDNIQAICRNSNLELEEFGYCGTSELDADYIFRACLRKKIA